MSDSVVEMAVNLTEKERQEAFKLYPGPTEFVHLHNHTLFSQLDGIATPEEYFSASAHLGHPAFSITDHGSMAAVPDAYWAAKKNKVKFIPGCEIYFAQNHLTLMAMKEDPSFKINSLKSDYSKDVFTYDDLVSDEEYSDLRTNRHLTVMAMNELGYRNLIHMTSKAWEIGFYYKPRIWFEQIEKYHEGLVILSGCLNGPICHALRKSAFWADISRGAITLVERSLSGVKKSIKLDVSSDLAKKRCEYYQNAAIDWIRKFRKLMGDRFYLEIQMPGDDIPHGKEAFRKIAALSKATKIPAVMTNDCLELDYPILMADGIFKPIGSVNVGDLVTTHTGEPKKVLEKVIRKRKKGERCYKLNGAQWSMTEGHSLWHPDRQRDLYKARLKPNNVYRITGKAYIAENGAFTVSFSHVKCDALFEETPEEECPELVCDIEVEDNHSFILFDDYISENCHYLKREDFRVQKCMMAIDQGKTINDPSIFHVDSDEQFFKSRAQLRKTFIEGGYDKFTTKEEFEQFCDNTVNLANRCNNFSPDLTPKLPLIPNADEELRNLVYRALKEKGLWENQDKHKIDGEMVTYRELAEKELNRYIEKGFASYFLIIRDLVKHSRDQGWPIGPGRGSAGGSLVCYLLQIHDLDPIAWGLSSIRFMGDSRGGYMLKVVMD